MQPINQENEMNNIFVLGDCAALKDEKTGRFYPPTAQLAQQQGEYLAQTLETLLYAEQKGEVLQKELIPQFEFILRGSICSNYSSHFLDLWAASENLPQLCFSHF